MIVSILLIVAWRWKGWAATGNGAGFDHHLGVNWTNKSGRLIQPTYTVESTRTALTNGVQRPLNLIDTLYERVKGQPCWSEEFFFGQNRVYSIDDYIYISIDAAESRVKLSQKEKRGKKLFRVNVKMFFLLVFCWAGTARHDSLETLLTSYLFTFFETVAWVCLTSSVSSMINLLLFV